MSQVIRILQNQLSNSKKNLQNCIDYLAEYKSSVTDTENQIESYIQTIEELEKAIKLMEAVQ